MKKIFALLAVVLGMVSCQTEPQGLDVNVGGEQDVTVCVSLPEATRANSAVGALDNKVLEGDATLRYILQIYQKVVVNGNETWVASKETQTEYSDENNVVFGVRLVPNRDYKFVVWADIVTGENAGDNYYITGALNSNNEFVTNLTNVRIDTTKWNAMDEARDAYTAVKLVEGYNGAADINVELTRPFAKLRVQTTDMTELGHLDITPTKATVEYTVPHYNAFNALAGTVIGDSKNRNIKHENFNISGYENGTLFVDYFFANNDVVKFDMTVYDQNQEIINKTINFDTDIPAKRNHLTTIKGNILTEANNIKVEVVENGAFANENIYIEGDFTLTENLVVDRPLVVRAGATAVIDLNGHNIINNTESETFGEGEGIIAYGNLTIKGNGTVQGSTMAVWARGTAGAEVNIYGGTFLGCEEDFAKGGRSVVYASSGNTINIYGGTVQALAADKTSYLNKTEGVYAALNVADNNGMINVYGGSFYKQNPAAPGTEPAAWNTAHPNGFVAEGYCVLAEDDFYTVVEGVMTSSKDELVNALENGTDSKIYFGDEIHMGTTRISLNRDLTLNMNNKKLYIYSGNGVGTYSFSLNNHKLTVNDADMQTEGFNVTFDSSLTFNSGKIFYKSSKNGRNLFYVASNNDKTATVTINGGDFSIDTVHQDRVSYIAANGNAIVYINGGNFGNEGEYAPFKISTLVGYTGQIIISGGTFKFNPVTYGATIAEGYVCSESNGTWTVVAE